MSDTINIDDSILRFIYTIAMRDATLQKAYNGEKKWLWEDDKVSKDIINELKNLIIKNKYNSQDDFDKAFLTTAKEICNIINGNKKNKVFTFGNAQKLINIFTKFLYIQTYDNEKLRENFKYCHCPMDSILLNAVWKNKEKWDSKSKIERSEFLASWGEETSNNFKELPNRYSIFQEAVRTLAEKEGLNSIEYDYIIW